MSFRCAQEIADRGQPRCDAQCPSCLKLYGAPTRRRDVFMETQRIREAAHGVADPDSLIAFAMGRASRLSGEYVRDPMEVLLDRDRIKDGKEEAADGVNHVGWWLDINFEHEDAHLVLEAMRAFIHAYDCLSRVDQS